jgi:hypothetical protein
VIASSEEPPPLHARPAPPFPAFEMLSHDRATMNRLLIAIQVAEHNFLKLDGLIKIIKLLFDLRP